MRKERDIPEMSDIRPYDPFPADVFIMGNAFKNFCFAGRCHAISVQNSLSFGTYSILVRQYKNLDFLSPVMDAMTVEKPSDRPSATDALRQFKSLAYSQGYFKLRRRLV